MREGVLRRSLGLARSLPRTADLHPGDGRQRDDARFRAPDETRAAARRQPASRPFVGTRARLLAVYVVLLVLAALLSTLAIRAILVVSLNERVENALEKENGEIDRHVTAGRDPVTGRVFPTLQALFDSYFAQHVPDNEEAVLTFIDGEAYRSNLEHFPVAEIPAHALATWAAFSAGPPGENLGGEFATDLGDGKFQTVHVSLGDKTGAFAVAILPAGELKEIGELQRYGVGVTLGVLLLASAAAWLVVGRTLAPVRSVTDTARSISQSDLAGRIEVTGSDEAAVMARSFNGMLDRLEAGFRAQREFIQDTSHELRDPLTISRGHLEVMGDDPDEQRTAVALVLDELDRMGRIVDDLQVLAEAEQPDFLRPDAVDLGPFTRELVAKAGALASRGWVLSHAAHGTMVADRHRLTEAVMNLAHNAVQHTVPDDAVAIGTEIVGDSVRISVADTGCGILLSDQARIFDRFTRGRGANRRSEGSGLGLAIVKAIAEAHGGRVELQSRFGKGSTFTIVIPQTATGGPSDAAHPDR